MSSSDPLAVVTKSFPEGFAVLTGVPARPIRRLDPKTCLRHRSQYEYHGFIPKNEFAAFRKQELNV